MDKPEPEMKDIVLRCTNAIISLQTSVERLADSVDDMRTRASLVHPSYQPQLKASWRWVVIVSALVASAVSVALAQFR